MNDFYKVLPHIGDLHITLFYLGGISADNLLPLKEAFKKVAETHSTFSLLVDGISYFGPSSGPRVVYLTVGHSVELTTLQLAIKNEITQQLSMPVSDRFVPHITIAKKRKTKDVLNIQKEKIIPIEIPVEAFSLFTVHLDKTPKYEAVETFLLT
ncbi:RNA 2',3'-cyclic phosphodiesterase [Filibacter tadaridae]|uniref:2',5' RNA ligase family n=1 Tax=Filibacter tadaridae TaxID=2483811 RepID=A0A3P5XA12_9BACL|nr:2',5' RNA ligase family [Filibacter tadaridae]